MPRRRLKAVLGRRSLRVEPLEDRRLLAAFDVLVYSETAGFRHASIDEGIAAVQTLGAANDFSVTATEDASVFAAESIHDYEAVVFMNTTGRPLNEAEQAGLQGYIRGGGGFVGVHAAADTHKNWEWYVGLVGAAFRATHRPKARRSSSPTRTTPPRRTCPRGSHSPTSGTTTARTPAATCTSWRRSTSLPTRAAIWASTTRSPGGNTTTGVVRGTRGWDIAEETFTDPLFLDHLLGGIRFAAGEEVLDGGAASTRTSRRSCSRRTSPTR